VGFVVLRDTSERVPVGKIVAAGSNYTDHTREMGGSRPDRPVLFLKPSTSIIHEGRPVVVPEYSQLLHHEVELGLVISRECKDAAPDDALDFVLGYLLALDLTLRDLQADAKKRGLPWAVAKGFDGSCPVSEVVPLDDRETLDDLALVLAVNGETRQRGSTGDMIWGPAELVSFASRCFTLERGDIILTGTPAGVGPLVSGDVVEASLGGVLSVRFEVA
jgi:acylpyruvate hydrolase